MHRQVNSCVAIQHRLIRRILNEVSWYSVFCLPVFASPLVVYVCVCVWFSISLCQNVPYTASLNPNHLSKRKQCTYCQIRWTFSLIFNMLIVNNKKTFLINSTEKEVKIKVVKKDVKYLYSVYVCVTVPVVT